MTKRKRAEQYVRTQVAAGRGARLTGKEVAEEIGMDPGTARAILRAMRATGECPAREAPRIASAPSLAHAMHDYFSRAVRDGWEIKLHRDGEVRDVVLL